MKLPALCISVSQMTPSSKGLASSAWLLFLCFHLILPFTHCHPPSHTKQPGGMELLNMIDDRDEMSMEVFSLILPPLGLSLSVYLSGTFRPRLWRHIFGIVLAVLQMVDSWIEIWKLSNDPFFWQSTVKWLPVFKEGTNEESSKEIRNKFSGGMMSVIDVADAKKWLKICHNHCHMV